MLKYQGKSFDKYKNWLNTFTNDKSISNLEKVPTLVKLKYEFYIIFINFFVILLKSETHYLSQNMSLQNDGDTINLNGTIHPQLPETVMLLQLCVFRY